MPFKKIQLAYFAGLIDGEGYIGISKHSENRRKKGTYYYQVCIKVGMTNELAPKSLHNAFGGYLYLQKRTKSKDIWQWNLVGQKYVLPVLKELLPYLLVKKEQAKTVIKYCEERIYKNGQKVKWGETSYSKIEDNLYQTLRELNKRGITATSNLNYVTV